MNNLKVVLQTIKIYTFSSTAKDSLLLFLGTVFSTLFSLAITVVLTHSLSTDTFGLFITAVAFSQMVFDIFELGINPSVVRFTSGAEQTIKERFVFHSLILKILVGIMTVISVILLAQPISENVFHNNSMIDYIRISSLGIGLMMLIMWGQSVLQALQKFPALALSNILTNLSRLLLIIIFIMLGLQNPLSLYWGFQLALLIVLIVLVFNVKPRFNLSSIRLEYIKKILKFGLPIGLAFALAAVYTKLDQILVLKLAGESAAGFYGLAFKVAALLILISTAFSSAIIPRFASLHPRDFNGYFRKTLLVVIGLAFIAIITIPVVSILIPLIFGSEYIASVPIYQILIIGISAFVISTPFSAVIVYKYNKTKFQLWVSIVALLLVWFGLNLLIPLYGGNGAAIAISAMYIVQLAIIVPYYLTLVKREKMEIS
ncbi:MAG: oligosaccharide flippase family protein [Patescibacteria group bacterium]|nr:oligosaccharide flippase family protein [Patescibacteria group bacterium]